MDKKLVIIIFLILSSSVFSQEIFLSTSDIDSNTKIIGRYSRSDRNKIYKEYNFIIEDSSAISNFVENLRLGNETYNSIENPNFKLTVVKNYKQIVSWTINPTQNTVMIKGHTFQFDLSQIKRVDGSREFDYLCKWKNFKTKEEYLNYLETQKSNPNFLFDYAPRFKFEGSFEIEFPKTDKFDSPKTISEYVKPIITKIIDTEDYSIIYSLNKKNMANSNQYTMTIKGPKLLFDKLKVDSLKNENWKFTVEEGVFFYKN